MDRHSKQVRSYNMSRIRSKDTKPEIIVRKFLHKNGFRFRIHAKTLPGKPDIVLKKYKTVIFVHGCFWHAHENCKDFKLPKSNQEYWLQKILKNLMKDKEFVENIKLIGWEVIIAWECEILKKDNQVLDQIKQRLLSNISGNK